MLFSQQLEGHLDRNGDALNDITGDMDLTSVEHGRVDLLISLCNCLKQMWER